MPILSIEIATGESLSITVTISIILSVEVLSKSSVKIKIKFILDPILRKMRFLNPRKMVN